METKIRSARPGNWIFQRPGRRDKGALKVYGKGEGRVHGSRMNVDYNEKIPNNVNLAGDLALQRALEQWQPNFVDWWREMGPEGSHAYDVYLRTAVSVDAEGWAHFDYVKMPDYRWGIFLAEPTQDRSIGFGDSIGQPVWTAVPGEHRNTLRRLIVTQGDTEPASVEQQRLLGQRCPSLYDMRNLFQVNVEEGRHLWAMVYLLHAVATGREEAEALLQRRSGDQTTRASSAPSAKHATGSRSSCSRTSPTATQVPAEGARRIRFDPLARTTRFMLTEERTTCSWGLASRA